MSPEEAEIRKEELALEHQKLALSRLRFWVVSVLIAIVTLVGNWTIQYYDLKTERIRADNQHLAGFKEEAINDNPVIRRDLAEFFKTLSSTSEARARWTEYFIISKDRVLQYEGAKKEKTKAVNAVVELQQELAETEKKLDSVSDDPGTKAALEKISQLADQIAEQRALIDELNEQIRRLDPSLSLASAEQTLLVDPPWLEIALAEIGVQEIAGADNNPRIIEYHAATTLNAMDDETPWTSSFVNWVMQKAGITGTKSALARSWLDWGVPQEPPRRGCIAVLSRPPRPTSGHVGFFIEERGDRVLLLGGNQNNQVNVSSYPTSRLIGCRWPAGSYLG